MKESFRQIIKEYLNFLKKDRDGIMVLIVLILLAIAGHVVVDKIEMPPDADLNRVVEAFEAWQNERADESPSAALFFFNPNSVPEEKLDSFPIPDFIKRNILRYRSAGGSFKQASDLKKIYGMNDSIFSIIEPWLLFDYPDKAAARKKPAEKVMKPEGHFDPNTALADELQRFGFNRFQISNILKYREQEGKFENPEDVLKIYGIDSLFFREIHKYIRIKEPAAGFEENSIIAEKVVELNEADSLDLVQLQGIGPVFASRIIKYRSLLGGYCSVSQLLEVYGFPEETFYRLKECFKADTLKVKKLRLNFAGYSELLRHPYLEKEHVKAILDFRTKNGPFLNEEQLIFAGVVDTVSFTKLKPYITCR